MLTFYVGMIVLDYKTKKDQAMCNNITLSQEEKFIKLIDKYITQHRDHTINAVFTESCMCFSSDIILNIITQVSNTATRVFMWIILCRCSQV